LRKKCELYIDKDGKESLETAPQKKFRPLASMQVSSMLFKEYQYSYFLRFSLVNTSADSLRLLFTAGEFWRQELLVKNKLGPPQVLRGYQSDLESSRAYKYDHKYLPIFILPHDRVVCYVKINDLTGKPFELKPTLVTYDLEAKERVKVLYTDRSVIFLNTAFYAILLNMVFVAFSLFYFSRKQYLLFFGLYVLFLLGYNVYGYSYSPFTITLFDYIPILKFQLRQSFYILGAQLAYVYFVFGFVNAKTDGTESQLLFFKVLQIVFWFLFVVEITISLLFQRYDWELYNSILVQLVVSVLGLVMIVNLFRWKNLDISFLFKIACACLFLGVIYGFMSAILGLNNGESSLFLYYPDFVFILFILLATLFFSSAIIQRFFRNFTEQGRLQKQYAISELNLLRSQINPHFLFNTLNSIKSSLFFNSPKESAKYLTDFSDLVRSILEKSREHVVSLKEELETTEQYLNLENRRFEKPFIYVFDKDLNIDLEEVIVPAFIIQPFVENSIKHGFKKISHNGLISISVFKKGTAIQLVIEDNGIGRKAANENQKWLKPHRSMGQQLISDRIKLLNEIYSWGIEVKVEDLSEPSGTKVILNIPKMN
jgi:sensor histidine kinase YesM